MTNVFTVKILSAAGNVFVVSLAFADLVVAFYPYPLVLYAIFHDGWSLGETNCKAAEDLRQAESQSQMSRGQRLHWEKSSLPGNPSVLKKHRYLPSVEDQPINMTLNPERLRQTLQRRPWASTQSEQRVMVLMILMVQVMDALLMLVLCWKAWKFSITCRVSAMHT
ncbi:uncharacterized protein LOC110972401 isoform X1 [Acanthochromis polyacanthus]|uniref:uncharacterized protein LOC110972401 isoform X1 n=1 Tax=Acanthochromis polyacanthus TaxID=80966 RepID=UPI002233F89B|nr:uncharacterized protein LOC110972401 isoform X1 [Acanthochromis polyacanthus]